MRHRLLYIALGVFTTALVCALAAPLLSRVNDHDDSRRRDAADRTQLRQLVQICKTYANDSPDARLPPLTPYAGLWMMDLERVYPVYLSDVSILVSPIHPDAAALRKEAKAVADREPIDWERLTRIAARSYVYTGRELFDEQSFREFRVEPNPWGEARFKDFRVNDTGQQSWRLFCGADRRMFTDFSRIPMAETTVVFFNTKEVMQAQSPPLANVAYFDGHAETFTPNERFPIQDNVLDALK